MPDPNSQSASVLPTQIGRYAILRKLGQGGMGAVYEAEHTKLQKRVALKVLPQEVSNDAAAVARFEREMVAVGRVSHPGIIAALDADEADGVAYLAMELVDGQDVSEVIEFYEQKAGKPIPLSVACEIVRQAALAMQAAHDAGLVHRDLKPSNLMLGRDGAVKVLDLGLALLDAKHSDGGPLTSTGQVMGTVDYMAPEQAAETHTVDARADVYSLGATLYRLIAGKAPYPSDRFSSMLQKLMAVASAEPTPIQELRPKCPDELAELVNHTMAKDPEARLTTAAELAEKLAQAGDADKLFQLAQQIPEREEIERSAIEATGTMIPETAPRMSADPSVDTDNSVGATFIGGASESAPTFIGGANGSQTITSPGSSIQWKRKKKPAVPVWVWGVGIAAAALLVITPFLLPGKPSPPAPNQNTATTDNSASDPSASPATEYLAAADLEEITRNGLTFDRPDAAIDCGEIDIDISKAFTLEMWCRPDPLPSVDERTSNVGVTLGPVELKRYRGPSLLSEEWQCGVRKVATDSQGVESSFESFFSDQAKVQPHLQHVAAQWDGKAMQLFLDGRLLTVKSTAFSGGVETSDQNRVARKLLSTQKGRSLRIGAAINDYLKQSSETQFFGTIYQVRVSSNARYSDSFIPQSLVADGTTKACYRFDEGSGDILRDASGNGHDGKIVGAEWVVASATEHNLASGLLFDGESSSVWTPPYPHDLAEPFTIEVIATPHSYPANEQGRSETAFLFGKTECALRLQPDGRFLFVLQSGENGPLIQVASETKAVVGGTTHVSGAFNGTHVQLFVDGQPQGAPAAVPEPPVGSPWLPIGGIPRAGIKDDSKMFRHFHGVMHEVRFSAGVIYDEKFQPPVHLGEQPSDATIAWYRFDQPFGDGVRDLSGNDHHGKVRNAEWVASAAAASAMANGLKFDGVDDVVRSSSLRFDGQGSVTVPGVPMPSEFTAEAWVEWDGLGTPSPMRGLNIVEVNQRAWLAISHRDEGKPVFAATSWNNKARNTPEGQFRNVGASTPAPANQRVHVALIREGRELRLYQDGSLAAQTTLPEGWFDAPFEFEGLKLGTRFIGEIGAFRYSSSVRYRDSFTPSTTLTSDDDTLVLFDFSEGSGTQVNDLSGNGYNGQIVGAEWITDEAADGASVRDSKAALRFSRPYERVSANAVPLNFAKPFTIETWFQLDEPSEKDRGSDVTIRPLLGIGPLQIRFTEGPALAVMTMGVSPADNRRYFENQTAVVSLQKLNAMRNHIAFVYDGADTQLFLNGNQLRPTILSGYFENGIAESDLPRKDYLRGLMAVGGPSSNLLVGFGYDKRASEKIPVSLEGRVDAVRICQDAIYSSSFTPGELVPVPSAIVVYDSKESSGNVLRDLSGNGFNGNILGAQWVGGSRDGNISSTKQPLHRSSESWALDFDGGDDWVKIESLRFDGSHPLTLEAHVTLRQQVRPTGIISSQIGAGVGLATMHNSAGIVMIQNKGKVRAYDEQPIPLGKDVHLAGAWDGSQLRFFVDGKLVSTTDAPRESLKEGQNRFALGAYPGPGGFFDGVIREARISRVARYAENFTPAAQFENGDETLALYHLDEGSGPIVYDASGNGHHGEIIGARWVRDDTAVEFPRRAGFGLTFAEADDRVELPPIPLDLSKPFTAEAWCTPNIPPDAQSVWGVAFEVGPIQAKFTGSGDRLSWNGIAYDRLPSGKVAVNTFGKSGLTQRRTHIAIESDGLSAKLYIDGKLQPSINTVANSRLSADEFYRTVAKSTENVPVIIGAASLDRPRPETFTGSIDSFRISTGLRYGSNFTPKTFSSEDATIVLYHFNEGTGDVLHDASGNGHNGRIVGAEWIDATNPDVASIGARRKTDLSGPAVDKKDPSPLRHGVKIGEHTNSGGHIPAEIDFDENLTIEMWVACGSLLPPGKPNRYLLHIDGFHAFEAVSS